MTIIGDFLIVTSRNLVCNPISKDNCRGSLIKLPTLCPARCKTLNTSFVWWLVQLNALAVKQDPQIHIFAQSLKELVHF